MIRRSVMLPGAIIAASVLLAGCATTGVEIHKLPEQTPQADRIAAIRTQQALQETLIEAQSNEATEALEGLAPILADEAPPMRTYDPWEPINRAVYRFNARFDEAVFLPVTNAYGHLPSPLRRSVHNFFGNLTEINSALNFVLQGRIGHGARSIGRFVINSTAGVGGLFDVAKHLKLPPGPTGFGVTLAKWGMHPGPYLVLPLLGPSTLRDAFGQGADFGSTWLADVGGFYRTSDKAWMLGTAQSIDLRTHTNFRYYSTASAFEYEMVRFLYVRKRLIEDEGLRKDDAAPRARQVPEPAQ